MCFIADEAASAYHDLGFAFPLIRDRELAAIGSGFDELNDEHPLPVSKRPEREPERGSGFALAVSSVEYDEPFSFHVAIAPLSVLRLFE
jgi:hypothetical protein